jgi:hypothetical protein
LFVLVIAYMVFMLGASFKQMFLNVFSQHLLIVCNSFLVLFISCLYGRIVSMSNNVFVVNGVSDDLVGFSGLISAEYDTDYADWWGEVQADNGEYVRLYVSYGSDGVEWKLRLENPYNWDVEVGERDGYEPDPALFITAPTSNVQVVEFDGLWDEPEFDVVAF